MYFRRIKIIASLSVLFFCSFWVQSKAEIYAVHPINNLEDVSQIQILDIAQDAHGFLWFATLDGLNRYDGYDYKIYRPSSKKGTINYHRVNSLLITQSNQLLVATPNGLQILNSQTNEFQDISVFNNKDGLTTKIPVTDIYQLSQGEIWIATANAGITILSETLQPIRHFNSGNSPLASNYIRSFYQDADENVWIGSNKGAYVYQHKNNSLVDASTLPRLAALKEFQNRAVNSFAIDNDALWIGTKTGLITVNLISGKPNEIDPTLRSAYISHLKLLNDSTLAVGTNSNGLFLLNSADKQTINYRQVLSQSFSLKNNSIRTLFLDRQNNLWISTDLGPSKITLNNNHFQLFNTSRPLYSCQHGNDIYATSIESKNIVWIATYSEGVFRIDTSNGKCKRFSTADFNSAKLSLKNTKFLHFSSNKLLWIGLQKNGLIYYDNKSEKFYSVAEIPKNSRVVSITENELYILVSTRNSGVYRINKNTLRTIQLLEANSNTYIRTSLIKNDNSFIIIDARTGVKKYSSKGQLVIDYDSKFSQLERRILDIKEDHDGNLWLASKGFGAYFIDEEQQTLAVYNLENSEIPSNMIWHIEIDNQSQLWFSTSKGLAFYNLEKKQFYNFTERDGLQDNPFTPTGDYYPEFDRMLTGGINGFNYFSPSKVKIDNGNSTVAISDFKLNNRPSYLLNAPSENLFQRTINLNYDQNDLAFKFSSLNFIAPKKINFAYKLEGYQYNWNFVDSNKRYAEYTNISPGSYVFKVKSTSKDGIWSDKETEIFISIKPPWWQSVTAYALYVVISIFALYTFINLRTIALQKKAEKLEGIVSERTQQLSDEKKKVEELLSKKNEEFANVSHEFRTPLTLIIGPVLQLLERSRSEDEINKLNIIQRSSYRLLRMVDQLLNLETFRVKTITQKSPVAISQSIKLVAEAFKDLAKQKNIRLTIGKIDSVCFHFTPDAIEKIILNLLSNALKYTPKDGEISIEAVRTTKDTLRVKISDNGVGISKEEQAKIFERFHRVVNEHSEQITGAGIGLALVNSLVKAHTGEISVQSKLTEGSTFIVELPIIDEVSIDDVNQNYNQELIANELMGIASFDTPEHQEETQSDLIDTHPRILVIEDNDDMRNYITQNLSSSYQVIKAKNGKQGIEIAGKEIPDLIISDVMMPEMDGYEATNQLRRMESTSHIPIILLTARGDRESRLKGWYEKADEYITKPFDVEELLIRIKNLLEIRHILKKRLGHEIFSTKNPQDDGGDLNTQEKKQLEFLARINSAIEVDFGDSAFKAIDITNKIGMSERQLYRKIKGITDMTPSEYLRNYRLQKACELLSAGHTASYVSLDVGFSSHSYFGKCFKAQFGCSPKEFQNQTTE